MRTPVALALLALTVAVAVPLAASEVGKLAPPAPVPELDVAIALAAGTTYDPAVPTPESLLGFPAGYRAATPDEIQRCLVAWSTHPRVKVVEYARSWEGRPLNYVVVTSPANQARLDTIKSGMARLADARGLDAGEAQRLADELPAVGWLGYSIHGGESSGSDASLQVLHHLIAGTSDDVVRLLDEVVVIIDPMQNPDGRARFAQQVAEARGNAPNLDDQSLVHSGWWPSGRGNHYLFDLNRDATLGVHPETRGRMRAVAEWRPLLVVDAHETGTQDTYLFAPQREPRNPYTPDSRLRWNAAFAKDQGAAFDARGWGYYTGEWNEGWYPGYVDSWPMFRGAVAILYEQARTQDAALRHANGTLLTYRESVAHHAVSSLANLETLRRNRHELLTDFVRERARNVAADGPFARRTFAILPTANRARFTRLIELLRLQNFELYTLDRPLDVADGVDAAGKRGRRTLPAGTLLVPNRQPEAPLVATMLELDTVLTPDYVARERRELLRKGESTIYDTTAWSTPLVYGLDALELPTDLPAGAVPLPAGSPAAPAAVDAATGANAVAWIVDGADDASLAFAARLLERGFEVRVADAAFELDGKRFAPGSVVVYRADNRPAWDKASAASVEIATALALAPTPIGSGQGEGDLPDLGGGHFRLLETPRIAVVARSGVSSYSFGTTWFLLDRELGVRHSHVDVQSLAGADLRRYNVIVVPDTYGSAMGKPQLEALATWVRAGGTLIATEGGAAAAASEGSGLGSVRQLQDVLADLDRFEVAVLADQAAATVSTPAADVLWAKTVSGRLDLPWPTSGAPQRASKEELARRDAWQENFMPSGAILATRVDNEHWLTYGAPPMLPVLSGRQPVLMAAPPVEAPVRYGVFGAAAATTAPKSDGKEGAKDAPKAERVGWSLLPEGQQLTLRLGGLLWPEAAQRMANSAWLTRESVGSGQVILFAGDPNFRASTPGTSRLLLNAIVLGPGFGADAPIVP